MTRQREPGVTRQREPGVTRAWTRALEPRLSTGPSRHDHGVLGLGSQDYTTLGTPPLHAPHRTVMVRAEAESEHVVGLNNGSSSHWNLASMRIRHFTGLRTDLGPYSTSLTPGIA